MNLFFLIAQISCANSTNFLIWKNLTYFEAVEFLPVMIVFPAFWITWKSIYMHYHLRLVNNFDVLKMFDPASTCFSLRLFYFKLFWLFFVCDILVRMYSVPIWSFYHIMAVINIVIWRSLLEYTFFEKTLKKNLF